VRRSGAVEEFWKNVGSMLGAFVLNIVGVVHRKLTAPYVTVVAQ
jgi:hypothetical protein